MKRSLKLTSVLLMCVVICSILFVGTSALDAPSKPIVAPNEKEQLTVGEVEKNLRNKSAGPMCIAHKGDWRRYPENTIDGILSASKMGADIVEIDVRRTADGQLVVFDDLTLDRMCVDAQGNAAHGNVSDVTLSKLNTYRLREGQGGPLAKATDYTVPTLDEVLKAAHGVAFLRIDHAWEYRDEVYRALADNDMLNSVMINGDASNDEINDWAAKNENAPMVIGTYHGVVVFSANSHLRELQNGGQPVIGLSTSNVHAILFDNAVTKNFGDSRILIDTTKPELCGDRVDGATGWDDLLSRGFTLFQTDSVQSFVRYRETIEPASVALTSVVGSAQAIALDLSSYDTASAEVLTEELESAQNLLVKGGSFGQFESARASLQSAIDNLQPKDTAKEQATAFRITPLRAVLAVVALAAFVFVQVYIYLKSENHMIAKSKKDSRTDK